MSQSKFIMSQKLGRIQEALMGKEINGDSLNTLLPVILEECRKEKVMFWFNFMEDACVLNLRDMQHENYELNIRYAYECIPTDVDSIDACKYNVLVNAFILLSKKHAINVNESKEVDLKMISGDKPVPLHINKAIKTIEQKGIPVTKDAIQHHLPLGEMSTDARMKCNNWLKNMEASD